MKKPVYVISVRAIFGLAVLFLGVVPVAGQRVTPKFEKMVVDDAIEIGYGIAAGDVDGDGFSDIVLADKRQFVWYQNPGQSARNGEWKKHILAQELTKHDNVCLAVRDLDGDGKVEIAVGGQWNPAETTNTSESGAIFYLVAPEDRTKKWEAVPVAPHEPTVHRMRWMKVAKGKVKLAVLPLHGRGNKNGKGTGVQVIQYVMPDNPRGNWSRNVVDRTMHMTHGLDVKPVKEGPYDSEVILVAGREGIDQQAFSGHNHWMLNDKRYAGAGEVRTAKNDNFVTIEPMHGNRVVHYRRTGTHKNGVTPILQGTLIDDTLAQGHALAVGNLLGIEGQLQVVAGWREKNKKKQMGIRLYTPPKQNAKKPKWKPYWIDRNGIACEDLCLADLDNDNKPEIIASGRSTKNVVVYWNRSGEAR